MPTVIYFGATSGNRISLLVDEDFVAVAQQLREANWVELTAHDKPVFINARNVWWIEERVSRSRTASFS